MIIKNNKLQRLFNEGWNILQITALTEAIKDAAKDDKFPYGSHKKVSIQRDKTK